MQKIGRLTIPKKMAQSLHSGTDECEPTSHAVIKKERKHYTGLRKQEYSLQNTGSNPYALITSIQAPDGANLFLFGITKRWINWRGW